MTQSYTEALADAIAELAALQAQHSETAARISRLVDTVNALRGLVNPEQSAEPAQEGFTDQVRMIIKAATTPINAPEIKEQLDLAGYPWPNPGNAAQSIHAVLQRLRSSNEIRPKPYRVPGKPGVHKVGWVWRVTP